MFKKPKALTALETEITRIQSILKTKKPTEDDYATTLTQVERLFALKELEKPERVSPDTQANVAANLIGIAMILMYENSHVITTKALSFAMRLK
jgi:hypothetical protein